MTVEQETVSAEEPTAQPGNPPMIICDGLVKIYKVADLETVALQGLDLVVTEGELLGVVGPSGSGKSTLLNILGGLDRPSAGRVWVDKQDLLKMSSAALNAYRRTKVGFVWQQSGRNLIPHLTAQENVELPMTLSGRNGRGKRQRAIELLESVGIGDRKDHRLDEMSGGEQQRVAIAVALANEPRLLLGDEPTGEVDSGTAEAIYDIFKRLNREHGLTTVLVTHDPDIARHVDRIVAIHDGKTASETRRQNGLACVLPEEAVEQEEEEDFEELVVMDSAGRLRIPKEYLERGGITGRRVKLETTEEGVLIRPAPQSAEVAAAEAMAADFLTGSDTIARDENKLLGLLRVLSLRALRSVARIRRSISQPLTRWRSGRNEGKK